MEDVATDSGWAAVAERLSRRMSEQGLTPDRVGGVDRKTVLRALEGKPLRSDSARRLALAVGWRADAFDRIRRGEEPLPREDDVSRRLEAVEHALAQVRHEVAEMSALLRGLEARED